MSSYYERKKRGGMKFRISLVIVFIIASFAVCFVLYMKSDSVPVYDDSHQVTVESDKSNANDIVTEDADNTDDFVGEIKSTADINPIAESFKLDKSYFDTCMFAGDSLIVGLGSYGLISEEQIAAGVGMSVISINDTPLINADGSEILAADKINQSSPQNLYILLGLNMLGTYTDEQLLASYGDFIDSIDRTDTNIYIISVPPVTADRENSQDNPILNSDIDAFNSALLKFANNKCVYYIDLNTALKGTDGRLSADVAESDGIHFKKETYNTMLDYLLTHVYLG